MQVRSDATNDKPRPGMRLGRGGAGVVDVVDLNGRLAARKTVNGDQLDEDTCRELVRNEVRTLRSLAHRGIPKVLEENGSGTGSPSFAMTLVDGDDLSSMLRQGGLSIDRAVAVVEGAARALAHAHRRGIVHADFKPSNIRVARDGRVFLLDWGLARPSDGAAGSSRGASGTVAYMAPEQARAGSIDRRTDVFNLGATLCHVLTGAPPHDDSDPESYVRAGLGRLKDAFDRLSGCRADRRLVRLARRCIAPDPARRPRDAGAVYKELARIRRVRARGRVMARAVDLAGFLLAGRRLATPPGCSPGTA